MADETVEEFRAKIKKLIDDVINVDPSQKLPQKFNKQRRQKLFHPYSQELIVDGLNNKWRLK